MRRHRCRLVSALLVLGIWLASAFMFGTPPQKQNQHFYNIDREVTVRGSVREVLLEPRFQDTAVFLMVILEENETGRLYKVEISPAWFFERDIHQGESLQVTGSLVAEGREGLVMARRVRFRGELLTVRDKHGFPSWRGGSRRGIKRRRR